MTGGWLDVLAKVMALVSPFALLWLGWFFKRRLDAAQAKANEAQARASDATAEKTRVETTGLVVSNAVTAAEKIIALYQAQQERQARLDAIEQAKKDKAAAEFRATATEKIETLQRQVASLERTQHEIATSLLPHAIWDGRIWHDARERIDPGYDPPPPFGLDGLHKNVEPDCPGPG